MIEALVQPSKVVSDQYRGRRITTVNGQTISGLLTMDSDNVWIVLTASGERIRIPADQVEDIEELKTSTMPDGLIDQLTAQDVSDLLSFLETDFNVRMAESVESLEPDSSPTR
jgi:putative heme-binding domain-containing protein